MIVHLIVEMRRTLLKLLSICMCMAVLQPSQPTLALPTATSASTSNITTQYTAPTTPIFSSTEDALLQSQQSQQSPPPSVSSSSAIAKEIDPLACIFLAIFLLVLCTLLYIFKFKRYFLWSLGFSSSSSNSNDRHDISPTQTASMAELERDFKKKVVLYEASLKLMEQLRLDNHQWQTPMNLQFLPSDGKVGF